MADRRLTPRVELTQARLKEVLRYEPKTGLFRWKEPKGSTAPQGGVAGSISSDTGYRLIRIDGQLYYAHRLAWLYVHGRWPDDLIDHANLIRSDNRFENLREATVSENRTNRGPARTNLSKMKGISRNPPSWMARIKFKGQMYHLGTFATPEQAHEAYCEAAYRIHGQFARTSG